MRKGLLVAAVLMAGLVIANARLGYQSSMVYLMFDWSVDSENQGHYDSFWDCGNEANVPLYAIDRENVINEAEVTENEVGKIKVSDASVETDCQVKDAVTSSERKLYERHYSICMTVLLLFITMVMLFFLIKPRKKK